MEIIQDKLTLDFIQKRLLEQYIYIENLFFSEKMGKITKERLREIYPSAKSQYTYFSNKEKEILLELQHKIFKESTEL